MEDPTAGAPAPQGEGAEEVAEIYSQLTPEQQKALKNYAESFLDNADAAQQIPKGQPQAPMMENEVDEATGDITLAGKADSNNLAAYQKVLNDPSTQEKIRQADSLGDNVNLNIGTNNSNPNDMTISVDGKDGLYDANPATSAAIAKGANVMVNSVNKTYEGRFTKKALEEMRLKRMEDTGTKLTKKQFEERLG